MKNLITITALLFSSTVLFAQTTKNTVNKEKTKIVDVKIDTAVNDNFDITKLQELTKGDGLSGMVNSFIPMMTETSKAVMNAQLHFFQEPGKLEEIAKLAHDYYQALIKQGFTEDQAIRIVIASNLTPKVTGTER